MIVLPTFPTQQNVNAPHAVSHPCGCYVFDPLPEWAVFSSVRLVMPVGTVQADNFASPSDRNLIGGNQSQCEFTKLSHFQGFFQHDLYYGVCPG
jgi:hypothetical protein